MLFYKKQKKHYICNMNNKLYTILRTFNKIEMNRLEKYILSPYFNKNQYLIQLFGLLMKNVESKNEKELVKEEVWKTLYQKEKYDDVRFRKLNSDLLKLVEGYLAQQLYDENPLHQAIYLMDAVARKKLDKLHSSTVRSAKFLSDKQQYRPASYYYDQYQIEQNLFKLSDFQRDEKSNIEEIINNLDRFYLAEKLKYYLDILARQNLISHEYEILFIEEIKQHLAKQQYADTPPVAIYYQIYLTYIDPQNEAHYFKLKELINIHIDNFPPDEAHSIYRIGLNYCISKINKNNLPFYEEYIALFDELLKNETIIDQVEISPYNFRNAIVASNRLKKYEWAENLIQNYQHKLPEDVRENTVKTNLASVYFYQKKYDKVIELLREVEFPDVLANLNAKSLLLLSYYDMNEFSLLDSFIESFKMYINRHKNIANQPKEAFLNQIKFVKKLSELPPRDRAALQKLKAEIEATKNVASLNWLKEKVIALER
jgi:hypothetical protein